MGEGCSEKGETEETGREGKGRENGVEVGK